MRTLNNIGNIMCFLAAGAMFIVGAIAWFIDDDFIKGGVAMLLSLAFLNTVKKPDPAA